MVPWRHCSGPRSLAQRCPRTAGRTDVWMQEKYPLEGTVRSCVGTCSRQPGSVEQDAAPLAAEPVLHPALSLLGYPNPGSQCPPHHSHWALHPGGAQLTQGQPEYHGVRRKQLQLRDGAENEMGKSMKNLWVSRGTGDL